MRGLYGKKDSVSHLRVRPKVTIMLNQFYCDVISRYLTPDQVITLEILVWLIQAHKTIKIERLAAYFCLPIKYESRRRRIQRFLKLER